MRRPPIRPVVWQPPRAPLRSRRRAGPVPLPPPRLIGLDGVGPEDVVVDPVGRVVTGLADGRVLRIDPASERVEMLADTGGRPLGIELLPDGRLLVCDARRGLLAVDSGSGAVVCLVDRVAGEAMRFCNNAAVTRDGTVFFSDSSRRFGIDHWRADLLEHSGTGRLLRRDPDGTVEIVLDGLQFANGVALAEDESFVVVAETGAYRLRRLWLRGERAGHTDVLVDNLPGIPDNLASGTGGLIWLALASPRDARLDMLHPRHPALRRAVWALPQRLLPERRTLWVQAVDASGAVVHDLQNPGRAYHMVTGVREHDGRLYLGSLVERSIAVLELPAAAR
ncbi:MAG TPA: SMP-30/gluconolactonase/LRE family protein [Pilimelia sp.]|nr:SMP-30/gluconolactonase/LRE family protein [Pilimelia sp.]